MERKTITISLPVQTIDNLKDKAKKLGMTVSGYINYLIIKDNEDVRDK